jgi:hypothetical protein
MTPTMARDKSHWHAMYAASNQWIRWCAKRCVDDGFLRIFERVHLIKTAAAYNANQCLIHDFSLDAG